MISEPSEPTVASVVEEQKEELEVEEASEANAPAIVFALEPEVIEDGNYLIRPWKLELT